jgi:hypothetical protein
MKCMRSGLVEKKKVSINDQNMGEGIGLGRSFDQTAKLTKILQ